MLVFVPQVIVTMPISLFEEHILAWAVGIVLSGILTAFLMIGATVVYFDLRTRKEKITPTEIGVELDRLYAGNLP